MLLVCDSRLGTRSSRGLFTSEAAMMRPLVANAQLLVGRRHARSDPFDVFFEVPAAAGVPDMLLVRFDVGAVEARERLAACPVVGTTSARVLSLLIGRRLEPADVAAAIGMTESHMRQSILPGLAEGGVAVMDGENRWSAAAGVRSLVESVVAVEAKRRDWKAALKQARRYSRFANITFMALDARCARVPLDHADDIVGSGVGLATVRADDGRVRVWRRPRWRNPRVRWESLLVGERLWELARNGRQSGPSFDVFGRTLDLTPDRVPCP